VVEIWVAKIAAAWRHGVLRSDEGFEVGGVVGQGELLLAALEDILMYLRDQHGSGDGSCKLGVRHQVARSKF
jgi:hypothetical protein